MPVIDSVRLPLLYEQGEDDVTLHSILTMEGERDADGHPHLWRAIQTRDEPLVFFNE